MAADAIVSRFLTRGGVRISRFRVETCPAHFDDSSLVPNSPHSALFGVGSGLTDSNSGLATAMREMRARFGESIRLEQVRQE